MGLFNLFSKKADGPYSNEGLNKIYNLLFCDNLAAYKSDHAAASYPWSVLFADDPEVEQLKALTKDMTLESRVRILAYNLLNAAKITTEPKELLGVIVEVALPEGLDVLAAYNDGTARYINHSEKLIVWDTQTENSKGLVKDLFEKSINVVNKIGRWDHGRKPFPTNGAARLTFLVSDGLTFGEGPFDMLANDAMGGPVIGSAGQLMAFLMEQTLKK